MKMFVVIHGFSQHGKSTMVQSLTGQRDVPVGDGRGESTTRVPSLYTTDLPSLPGLGNKVHLTILDNPGSNDSLLRFTKEENMKAVELALVEKCNNRSNVDLSVLVESLTDSTISIRENMQEMIQHYGEEVLKSTVVVGTKPTVAKRMAYPVDAYQRRLGQIKVICKELGVCFVIYEAVDVEGGGGIKLDSEGASELAKLVLSGHVATYNLVTMKKIEDRIKARAHEMMENAPVEYTSKEITESYVTTEIRKVTESYIDYQKKWKGGLGKVTGKKKVVPVQRTRVVDKCVPVEKTRPKTVQVEIPKKLSKYLELSKEEWIEKTKKQVCVAIH